MIYSVFDQNVREKLSKKGNRGENNIFQDKMHQIVKKEGMRDQLLTPCSVLEFAGCSKKEIFDIKYKGKKWGRDGYKFSSYKEFDDLRVMNHLKKKIEENIPKSSLEKKLKEKRLRESKYLTDQGLYFIDCYIKSLDPLYDSIIDSIVWDRLFEINTSALSNECRWKFINSLTSHIFLHIYKKGKDKGYFRMVYKIWEEVRKLDYKEEDIKEDPGAFEVHKKILNILGKAYLKTKGDLVDCELIHLAFFGSYFGSYQKGAYHNCHIYTTDNKEHILQRLKIYCSYIKFIIEDVLNYKVFLDDIKKKDIELYYKTKNNTLPEWKFGKVFILDKRTGKILETIFAKEIYEKEFKFQT